MSASLSAHISVLGDIFLRPACLVSGRRQGGSTSSRMDGDGPRRENRPILQSSLKSGKTLEIFDIYLLRRARMNRNRIMIDHASHISQAIIPYDRL